MLLITVKTSCEVKLKPDSCHSISSMLSCLLQLLQRPSGSLISDLIKSSCVMNIGNLYDTCYVGANGIPTGNAFYDKDLVLQKKKSAKNHCCHHNYLSKEILCLHIYHEGFHLILFLLWSKPFSIDTP